MTSVKIKFRSSMAKDKQGTIYYQVIHRRIIRQIRTDYQIHECEWNSKLSEISLPRHNCERLAYLTGINEKIQNDMVRLGRIIESLGFQGRQYETDEVVSVFVSGIYHNTFFHFMEDVISKLSQLGKSRIAESYSSTLCSFKRFREDNDVIIKNMDSDMMIEYEAYLKSIGLRPNTISYYMRNLRAVYNRAVDKELTIQRFPFRHVYTGVEKTMKRAVPLNIIKKLKAMDLSKYPHQDFARDMFLFSFYTRGMSFVDMAYLKKKDLSGGTLSYRRRKTNQQLFIRWEKCMQDIVDKYDTDDSIRMLPIINSHETDERKRYLYSAHNVNRNLKIIGGKMGLSRPLTMYVARHAWASIAKSKNVPLSVISEGMGHDSETTTRIYLASLDNMAIDKANSMILKLL